MDSLLYVFLPCKKVYPTGITYLADFIHRRRPEVRQQILDLSLFPLGERSRALRETVQQFQPELVCFSWRDIQIFSPHEGDASLEQAFNFYYASNPLKRVAASFQGLRNLYRYYQDIRRNLSYPWLVHREFPDARLMIGGGAFTAFADQLIEQLPDGTLGILGEGEDAILKVLNDEPLTDERFIVREHGRVTKGEKHAPALLDSLTVDLPYLTSIFPQYPEYVGECIGVQSKRGCPYDCAFCLYPYIEGKRVRYRPAQNVVHDIAQYYHQWGRAAVLVYGCAVHYGQGGVPAMHGDPGTDYWRGPGDRVVGLRAHVADFRGPGEVDGAVRRGRPGSGDHRGITEGAEQLAHGVQAGTPV